MKVSLHLCIQRMHVLHNKEAGAAAHFVWDCMTEHGNTLLNKTLRTEATFTNNY